MNSTNLNLKANDCRHYATFNKHLVRIKKLIEITKDVYFVFCLEEEVNLSFQDISVSSPDKYQDLEC